LHYKVNYKLQTTKVMSVYYNSEEEAKKFHITAVMWLGKEGFSTLTAPKFGDQSP